jgi:hypothetical protein
MGDLSWVALTLCILAGCANNGNSPCSPGQTRCVGDSAQVCLASGQWREFESCSNVGQHSGGTWQCGPSSTVDGGVTCVGGGFCEATDPTPEMVRAFWSFMEQVHGATRIDKTNAPEMQLLGDLLQTLGIENRDIFLTHYTTTIGTRIYTPFEPGVPTPDYNLWAQMVIGVHEIQHVFQYRAEGVEYLGRYVADGFNRADYEAEAYRTRAELDWWRYRTLDSAEDLANHLLAYNCTSDEIGLARQIIQLTEETVQQGGLVSDTTATAIEWLQANAPALRVPG